MALGPPPQGPLPQGPPPQGPPPQGQRGRLTAEEYDYVKQNAVLLRTGYSGDCTVSCEGRSVRLHKWLLCERSSFFRACFEHEFMESISGVVDIQEYVTWRFLWLIIRYMYLSIPKAGLQLQVYGQMTDAQFYELMFELYRQANYLRVHDLKDAIIKELKDRLGRSTGTLFARLQRYPTVEIYKKAYEDPMKAAVFAYDTSNLYYDVYEPVRAELFRWIQHCYPALCRLGDDFDDYLREAPELGVTILKTMRNIESSKFISPGPEALCMFCDSPIWQEHAMAIDTLQPMFGVMADRRGHVRYFCYRPSCFRKISMKRCFTTE